VLQVHAIFPDYVCPADFGLLIPKTSDGRVLFILPWEGSVVIGTTDRTAELQDLPTPTLADVNWMLAESNKFLQRQVPLTAATVVCRNHLSFSFSGAEERSSRVMVRCDAPYIPQTLLFESAICFKQKPSFRN
jgi:hypothetical protein